MGKHRGEPPLALPFPAAQSAPLPLPKPVQAKPIQANPMRGAELNVGGRSMLWYVPIQKVATARLRH
ncbi:hypothetical protein BX070DRAFT_222614 [Coemansia spiralis]|nr:hypothetical protein BX070DRAFT_222614 [Coemansia spiralis]